MSTLDPMPQSEPLVAPAGGGENQRLPPLYMNGRWMLWFYNALIVRLGNAAARLGTALNLTAQAASIGATALPLPTLTGGRIRISWYARITTAASVSSSLTVTFSWTETAQSLSISGAALTGNSTTSVQSGTVMLNVDGGSSVSYATTYASNAAGMQYLLTIYVEQLP